MKTKITKLPNGLYKYDDIPEKEDSKDTRYFHTTHTENSHNEIQKLVKKKINDLASLTDNEIQEIFGPTMSLEEIDKFFKENATKFVVLDLSDKNPNSKPVYEQLINSNNNGKNN